MSIKKTIVSKEEAFLCRIEEWDFVIHMPVLGRMGLADLFLYRPKSSAPPRSMFDGNNGNPIASCSLQNLSPDCKSISTLLQSIAHEKNMRIQRILGEEVKGARDIMYQFVH